MEEVFNEVIRLENELFCLKDQITTTQDNLNKARSKLPFACGCGRIHTFGECTLIIELRYIPPSGCTDGDYHTFARMSIDCPTEPDKTNRLIFSHTRDKTDARVISTELNFKRLYTKAFFQTFERPEKHPNNKQLYFVNTHIDEHQEMYGI